MGDRCLRVVLLPKEALRMKLKAMLLMKSCAHFICPLAAVEHYAYIDD
jgi:hypothetical protein